MIVRGSLERSTKRCASTWNFPAPFRGELGHSTSRGPAGYRAIQALYQTWRLFQLVGPKQSIVEIGPGMGRTAYYAYRAGLTDYTTIDLPLGVVAQACFLGAVLGADKIWMEGDDEGSTDGRIKLLSTKPKRQFDIALNVEFAHGNASISCRRLRGLDISTGAHVSFDQSRTQPIQCSRYRTNNVPC